MNSTGSRKKHSLKERIRYWFDNRMSKGSIGMIGLLAQATLIIILVITLVVFLLNRHDGAGFGETLWDSMAYTINAWLPFSEEGSFSFLIPTAIASICGVLLTSILIGFIGSAIEDKITQLRRGNSMVLEDGHTVILGFIPGEYELIHQLILAAAGSPLCIVVAGDMEKDEMEDLIRDNIDRPSNVRIICRHVDVTDIQSLSCCSIDTCRTVIVSPADNERTIRILLAVLALLEQTDNSGVCNITAAVSDDSFLLPEELRKKNNICILRSSSMVAKVLARACTQPGLSEMITEIFNFEGSEFYSDLRPEYEGLSFKEAILRSEGGMPVGIIKDGATYLNPAPDMKISAADRLIFFSDDRNSLHLTEADVRLESLPKAALSGTLSRDSVTIIGKNDRLESIIASLPSDIDMKLAGFRKNGRIIDDAQVMRLIQNEKHFILLNDTEDDASDSDIDVILLLLKLREFRTLLGLDFSIAAELSNEKSRKLVNDDSTDFIVANDMFSMGLAQISESPELAPFFSELLSSEGSELYLKDPADLSIPSGRHTVREFRAFSLSCGFLFLGTMSRENGCRLYSSLNEQIEPAAGDHLILIGEH